MQPTATNEPWRMTRTNLLNEYRMVMKNDEHCPYYMTIPTPFLHMSKVLPEEQEELVFNELIIFLTGAQTDNIRIGEEEDRLPKAIDVNISFDPYLRAELERFQDILVAIAIIKICCFELAHDNITYSPIVASVAKLIDDKVADIILRILERLGKLNDPRQQLNSLFRELHAVTESFIFYSDIVRTIRKDRLLGGQVLTLLESKRRLVFANDTRQNLEDAFQAGWKVFAGYIGRLVCKFEADMLNYEFVVWSTRGMTEKDKKTLSMGTEMRTKSANLVVVPQLCPSFFVNHLDILVRCAEFGDMSKGGGIKKTKKAIGKREETSDGVEGVMDAVRKIAWQDLDVPTTVRMLVQFSRKESACLLREITAVNNVDLAIRDVHELLLKGHFAHEVMMRCVALNMIERPVDECGQPRLKKLTHDVLSVAAEKHHNFWKYFRFVMEKEDVFEILCRLMRRDSMHYGRQQSTPPVFERLSLFFDCPIEMEPVVSTSAVSSIIPVFRLWLQLHTASWKLANARDEVRGQVPTRSGAGDLLMRTHLLHALSGEVSAVKQKFAHYVNVALMSYHERISKAVSLDEYNESQTVLTREIAKMLGLMEWSQLAHIKDLLTIVWKYEDPNATLGDLAADFEDLQSNARMDAVV